VSETPEERLADVLAVRSLSPDEARDVLESTLAALEYLHDHKFLHGAYEVDHIVACDGRAKLTTSTLRRFSPSTPEHRAAFLQEIRQVGDCTVRMLSKPGAPRLDAKSIPPEFAMILRTASMGDERWSPTAVDLLHALKGVNIAPRDAAEARSVQESVVSEPPVVPDTVAVTTPFAIDTQPAKDSPAISQTTRVQVPRRQTRRLQIATVAAVAFLAAVLYVLWPTPRVVAVKDPPARPEYGARARSTQPTTTKPAPQPPRTEERPTPALGNGEWAVVAATYRDRRAAERRAEQLAGRWNVAKPQVVPPVDGAPRYLVVLGSRLSKAEATRLRNRAASKGMPRDSYVTKLSW
jgi:hypothetical protein